MRDPRTATPAHTNEEGEREGGRKNETRASTWVSTLTCISQISIRPTHDLIEGPYLQKLTLSIKSQSPDFRARTNMLSTHSNVPQLRPLADCISFTPKLRNSSTSLANSETSQPQYLISNQGNQKQTNKTKN